MREQYESIAMNAQPHYGHAPEYPEAYHAAMPLNQNTGYHH